MTFGEKLYQLRKRQGLSQEALAEKLNTSRQAISKWENNNGYPETEKIIQISKIFEINLEELLIDEKGIYSEKPESFHKEVQGFYVNRETANGFLLYYKRKFLLLAAAFGIILGFNAASYTSTEHQFYTLKVEPLLITISAMITLGIVIYITLKQNPYRVLRKKELVFADDVRREIEEEFGRINKMLAIGIAVGLILLGASNISFYFNVFENMKYTDIILSIAVTMVMTAISSFITFFCIGIYWSYSILLRNNEKLNI